MPPCRISLPLVWTPVLNTAGGPYRFPTPISSLPGSISKQPAVYRWRVLDKATGKILAIYVGEGELLGRRINHYITPGPSQKTNLRNNADFTAYMGAGHHVELDILVPSPDPTCPPIFTDFKEKYSRRMWESAGVLEAKLLSGVTILNR